MINSQQAQSPPDPAPHPRLITWTQAAGCCAAITTIWLIFRTTLAWLDNRGQPWLGWALKFAIIPPLLILIASLFAWRGRGWLRRTGWGLLILLGTMMTEHLIRENIVSWWANHQSRTATP